MGDWNEEVLQRIRELIDQVKGKWEELLPWKSLSNWISNGRVLFDIIEDVVLCVEQTYREFDDFSADQKVDYAAKILDDLFKFPWILERLDQQIFKMLISMVVEALNKHFGHDWSLALAAKFRLK
jgi:hypothetical protein